MLNNSRNQNRASEASFELLIQIWMRFIIAFASLLVFLIAPFASHFPAGVTRVMLISYCLYSACFVFIFDMQQFRKLGSQRFIHWIDTLYFSILIVLTGGVDSIFFFFFFFPIIVASFTWGFTEGILVIFASSILFTIGGLISFEIGEHYEIAEAILRPIFLVVFGSVIAYWGGDRIIFKRRLELLQEISSDWSPRFGINHAISVTLSRLSDFYQANRCFVVISLADLSHKFVMYSADRRHANGSEEPKVITKTTANELLSLPNSLAIAFENPTSLRLMSLDKYIAYDIYTLETTERYLRECETISTLLDGESFITVPYRQKGIAAGRIFLAASDRSFNQSDVAFALQVADAMSSVVDNMQLIEDLIEDAGGHERHRISLDVHDTTIQPYIGLTLALTALSTEFGNNPLLADKIGEIIQMANMTIQDLRSYKDTLREKSLMRGDFLFTAIVHQADRLHRFYGIEVEVLGSVDPNLSGRLAEAAFQIVKEGLSNILRHTAAKKAFVSIHSDDTSLNIEIGNDTKYAKPPHKLFKPKSIFERTSSFNGMLDVAVNENGYMVVCVKIPLVED